MLLSKFKIVLMLSLLVSVSNLSAFDYKTCLKNDFKTSVSHKGWPFGLTQKILTVAKDKCDIEIKHERLKYVKQAWRIDVCREPVHLKKGNTSVEVIKKKGSCKKNPSSGYCSELKRIKEIIQDDGLIFAKGDKNDLSQPHGQVYCAYQLLKLYGDQDVILGLSDDFVIPDGQRPMKTNSKLKTESVPRPVMEGEQERQEKVSEEGDQDQDQEDENKPSSARTF